MLDWQVFKFWVQQCQQAVQVLNACCKLASLMNDIRETTLPHCILIVFMSRKESPKLYTVCKMVYPTLLQGLTTLVCQYLLFIVLLYVHDGVLTQKDVQDLLASRRRIVGHCKHSNEAFHLSKPSWS